MRFSTPGARLAIIFTIIFAIIPPPSALAAQKPNYHLVGWFNTFVPGGGQFLLGRPWVGAQQLALEGTTFGYGYALSPRQPMTIDGVPESLEVAQTSVFFSKTQVYTCTKENSKGQCTAHGYVTETVSSVAPDGTTIDNRNAGYADILQEFGLKYHMVNVFNAYREAAGSPNIGQGIDQRPTSVLFTDPFRWSNIKNPWVYVPLALLAGFVTYDYFSSINSGLGALQPMNAISNRLLAFNYEIWQPFGSGAPEEMFYRGFFQNEMYSLVPSPFFSIPMSTLAFTFSHQASGRPTAAIAGTYLGFLAHHNHGTLGPGIALHFWTVVMLGIETIALTDRAQGYVPLRYVTFDIEF